MCRGVLYLNDIGTVPNDLLTSGFDTSVVESQVQKQNRLNPRAHLGLSLFFCMAQQHLFHSNQEKFDGVLHPM